MENKVKELLSVDVYLDKRKSREYVGRLSREGKKFIFTYDNSYLYKTKSIPLGPDLPLTKKKFSSKNLFPTFEDRIPSKNNPAYSEYCKMAGIDPAEDDPIVLLTTLGHKGPSSFIFTPASGSKITDNDIINFRKNLKLTIREFSDLFDFATATVNRIEKKPASVRDSLKRLEIYYNFPKVALFEIRRNKFKVQEKKIKKVKKYLKAQYEKNENIKVDDSQKENTIRAFLHWGHSSLLSSKKLFSQPSTMYPASFLAHHGIELILKACWIWDKDEYNKTHKLTAIANQINFLKADKKAQELIAKINTFYYHRYPMDEKELTSIQEVLNRINDNTDGIPNQAGELCTTEWEKAEELYCYVVNKMPDELYELWEKVKKKYLTLV